MRKHFLTTHRTGLAVAASALGRLRHRSAPEAFVITSQPYLNAIDYMRCSKFFLIWMGRSAAELREVRRYGIGPEAGDYSNPTNSARILLN